MLRVFGHTLFAVVRGRHCVEFVDTVKGKLVLPFRFTLLVRELRVWYGDKSTPYE